MPESETQEPQATDTGQETPATEVDWKAKARDWESRSKQNHKDLQAAQQELQEAREQISTLTETNTGLASQVQEFETAQQQAQLAREVSQETGIPADALRGSTKDELLAHANQIKAFMPPASPVIHRQADIPGSQPADPTIEAVRNLFG